MCPIFLVKPAEKANPGILDEPPRITDWNHLSHDSITSKDVHVMSKTTIYAGLQGGKVAVTFLVSPCLKQPHCATSP